LEQRLGGVDYRNNGAVTVQNYFVPANIDFAAILLLTYIVDDAAI